MLIERQKEFSGECRLNFGDADRALRGVSIDRLQGCSALRMLTGFRHIQALHALPGRFEVAEINLRAVRGCGIRHDRVSLTVNHSYSADTTTIWEWIRRNNETVRPAPGRTMDERTIVVSGKTTL